MSPDLKREYCGCLLSSDRRASGDMIFGSLLEDLSKSGKLWSGIYATEVNHTPVNSSEKARRRGTGPDAMYIYPVFALDLRFKARQGTLLLAPYYTLAREIARKLKERATLSYFKPSLAKIEDLTLGTEDLDEQACLLWSGRIDGDGSKAKLLTLAGGDVLRSTVYKALIESFQGHHLRATPQRVVLGSNRPSQGGLGGGVLRRHEVRVSFDLHGNVRLKSPLDEIGLLALFDLLIRLDSNGVVFETDVCPLTRSNETSGA